MEIEGTILTANRLFALLILGLGPIRISLAWLVIARDLDPLQRRQVAWRITWVGIVIAIGIMVLGFSIRNILPELEWIAIGVGLVLVVSTLYPRVPQVGTLARLTRDRSIMEIAAFPLAVPTMINPAGMGLLIAVAAFVREPVPYLSFFGVVVGVFLLNFGILLLIGRIQRTVSAVVIQIVGQVFAIVLTALGASLIINALAQLGVITLNI